MLDIGWQELLVIGVLALLVVGPKELPKLLRTVGQYAGKARSVARDFQRSMEDAAREADLEDLKNVGNLKRDMEKMARLDYADQAKKAMPQLKGGKAAETGAGASEAAPTTGAETVASGPAGSQSPAPDTPSEPPKRAAGASDG
jgi:sec-independent protein translocase protein TatB